MIQTSSGYLAAVNSTSREWSARLASSGTAINAEIMSVTVHKGTRGDELNVGTMYAPYFEATIRGYSGASLLGSTLTFDLGLTVSGATEWATIATGTVISAKAQGVDLLLTLAGPISALGDQIIESTSTAVTDVITEIQTKLGTTVTCRDGITSLTGTLAAAMTGQTIRGALQSLAAFFGGYVTENAAGQIVIGGLSQTSTTAISPDTYQEEPELSTGTYEITGWRVFVNSETYYLEGTEPYLDTACQFMTQSQFNAIKADVIGEVFRGGSIDQTLGNPLIEPWDVLTLTGSAETMPRLGAVTVIYDGGISVRIESPVTTDDEQPAQVVGPLSGQVAEAAAAADSAKTSAEEALEAAQEVNNHFYVDNAGLHVTLLESSPNTGQNILIDSYGLQVRDGTTPLASFENTGAQIGRTGDTHAEIDYHSMQLINKQGNAYFYASDLRDQNGEFPWTETWTGNGSTRTFGLVIQANNDTYPVTVNGTEITSGITKSRSLFTFASAPADGDVIEASYKTSSQSAVAFTLGTRAGTVAPGSVVLGNNAEASGVRSVAAGLNTKATGATSFAEGSSTIASGQSAHSEGQQTEASGHSAHAEGGVTTASGSYSHAEGNTTTAAGYGSHAQNSGTVAGYSDQTAIGAYNDNKSVNLFEIGNGTPDNPRNAFTVNRSGIPSFRNPSNTFGTIFDLIYPVGSIYMSANSTYPGTLFGGTWTQVEDTFLLAAGSNHAAGSSGGEETVTLTAAQSGLPAHTHGFTQPTVNGGAETGAISGGAHGHTANYRSVYNGSSNYSAVSGTGGTGTTTGAIVNTSGSHTHNLPAHTHSVSGGAVGAVTGGAKAATSAHNNMPPYLAVYVWQRTA